MLTVEDYGRIRTAKRDGMSIRAICRTYHHSHHTVGTALNNPQPRPYTRTKPTVAPVLGPFMPIIEQILLEDGSEPAEVQVDKYQTVRFETNRYSVPRRWACVKGGAKV